MRCTTRWNGQPRWLVTVLKNRFHEYHGRTVNDLQVLSVSAEWTVHNFTVSEVVAVLVPLIFLPTFTIPVISRPRCFWNWQVALLGSGEDMRVQRANHTATSIVKVIRERRKR